MVDLGNINTISLQGLDFDSLGIDFGSLNTDALAQITTDFIAQLQQDTSEDIGNIKMSYKSTLEDTDGVNDEAIFSLEGINAGTGITDEQLKTAFDTVVTNFLNSGRTAENQISEDDIKTDNISLENLTEDEMSLAQAIGELPDSDHKNTLEGLLAKMLDGEALTEEDIKNLNTAIEGLNFSDEAKEAIEDKFIAAAADEIDRSDGKLSKKKGTNQPNGKTPPLPYDTKETPNIEDNDLSGSGNKENTTNITNEGDNDVEDSSLSVDDIKSEVADSLKADEAVKDNLADQMFGDPAAPGATKFKTLSNVQKEQVFSAIDQHIDHVMGVLQKSGKLTFDADKVIEDFKSANLTSLDFTGNFEIEGFKGDSTYNTSLCKNIAGQLFTQYQATQTDDVKEDA